MSKEQKTTAMTRVLSTEELARIEDTVSSIEAVAREYGLAAAQHEPPIRRAIRLSQGIAQLRNMLSVEQTGFLFMPLMGSPLGFVTDMDHKPVDEHYKASVVRDVIIEALLRGFMPVGNEFNIIAGRFYAAKNGLERLVREYPGLTNLVLVPGVPVMVPNNQALVPYVATWKYQGKDMELRCEQGKEPTDDRRIPVRVNAGMGPDAILGKAERKMYWRILKRMSGEGAAVVDLGPEDEPVAPVLTQGGPAPASREHDGRRMRLGAGDKAAAASEDGGQPRPTAGQTADGELPLRQPGEEG